MAKPSGGKSTMLLRLSGLIFGLAGAIHVSRYFLRFDFKVGNFELTYLGSLIIGTSLLLLSFSCFRGSK